jgi:hypothetical protein
MRVFAYTFSSFMRLETSLSRSHCVRVGARWRDDTEGGASDVSPWYFAINFAYWKLGVSYQAFADVSLPPYFLVLRLSWRDSADVPIWVPRFILERNRKCSSRRCATNLTFKWRLWT